jgi:serine/threonine protein kinase
VIPQSCGGCGSTAIGSARSELPTCETCGLRFDAHVGEILDERYQLLGVLGSGAMGVVYLAEHQGLNDPKRPGKPQRVALKVIAPGISASEEIRRRLVVEANAMHQLAHDNVVALVDFVPSRVKPYLVLEYVPGPSGRASTNLSDVLRRGPLPMHRGLDVVLDVVRGMEAAHAIGVLHRDLKPGNVLIDPSGRARVTDFGIARLSADPHLRADTAGFVGTFDYAAPEQLEDAATVDVRADVYSCGRLLYRTLTGKLPRSPRAAPPSSDRGGIHPALDRLVLKALEPEPMRRFRSMEALREGLEAVISGPAGRFSLRWHSPLSGGASGGEAHLGILLAQDEVLLGRDVDENDIVLQLLPQTEQNRSRSLTISRVHARLRRHGDGWAVSDQGSTHGTRIDGRRLRAGEAVPLPPGAKLELGPWMTLELEQLKHTRVEAVILHRRSNFAESERYLIVERALGIGSGPSDGIPLKGAEVVPGHARLIPREGLWILEARHPGVVVNGKDLPVGGYVKLRSGVCFEVGGVSLEFARANT